MTRIELQDADVSYLRHVDFAEASGPLLRRLIDTTPWRSERIVVWGKTYPQPRLIAWYGDDGKSYRYSGIRWMPLAWTDDLLSIKARVESITKATFNGVLLNYYRDQNDSMGMHSDAERELGSNPVIASISLGETRTFLLKHKTRKDLPMVRIPLECGSLLLMQGSTQEHWKHGIAKQRRACGARVNLTFRRIYS